ncbi:MAG: ABC transporter ATP-binding protein [Clostridium sp.]|nr:ABC transporter ATP-binding protein [Clostridium sp.]
MNKDIKFSSPDNPERLWSYVKKYKKQFLITALAGIFYNSAIVLGPIFQGKLLDAAIESKTMSSILNAGLAFIGITASFQLGRFFKRYYVRDMANRMSGDMRIGILSSVLSKDLKSIQNEKVGDLMTRTIGDVDIVVEAVRKTITELWDTWVLMIAYFVALLFYDVKITLIASLPIPIAIITAQLMKKVIHKKNMESRRTSSKTTLQIRKMISGANTLRIYGREDAELMRLEKNLEVQARKTAIASVLKTGLAPIYTAVSTIGILIVIGLGGKKVLDGEFSIGTFTAYITMFTALAARTTTAAKVFNIQQGAKSSWDRIKTLFGTEKEEDKLSKSLVINEINVKDMSFKYKDDEEYILKNISFKCNKGMIIGITGPVGSGKSALSLALTGLYNYEGNICLDGIELRDMSVEERLATISYSGHNPFLFSNSIKDNITWGEDEDKRLDEVIKSAALSEDIKRFTDGLKTEVGERGIKVSGGQKQRISLARALYKNSSIIILDDPFSAVDILTEAELIKALSKEAENKVIFIFSHRLDNFKNFDKILVLNKGEIVEAGNHEELMNNCGIYSKILESQNFSEMKVK